MFAAAILAGVVALATTSGAQDLRKEVVAFTGGDYTGWQEWNWDAITVLGFWTDPSDEVRAKAKASNVRLFADSHLLDAKDWTDSDKRKAWVQDKVQQVTKDKLDGIFFDFEGHATADQKKAYTKLAQETTNALKPLNATVFVCVGAAPSYEERNYDYPGLASATDFLFIMGYDAHFWDDYTCVVHGTCSPAEAPIKVITDGVVDYLKQVAGEKLVLGLPWYGQLYEQILVPWNMGQVDYKDVLAVLDDKHKVKSRVLDKDSQTWVLTCNGPCLDGKKGGKIWFDDAQTLQPKYQLAHDHKLRGVGVWEITKLDYSGKHELERKAMWATLAAWNNRSFHAMRQLN
jgi:spore germination protein YaaH